MQMFEIIVEGKIMNENSYSDFTFVRSHSLQRSLENYDSNARLQEKGAKYGAPAFLLRIAEWLEHNRGRVPNSPDLCGEISFGDLFDELEELIDAAIRTWDQDPIIRKIARRAYLNG
ncbi:MAG TPA: hypothetical protein VK463_11880 [Desulfomonilaceae bacterium]|nr:hypothetical protein [Desulfomonilaceae bacterium]